QVGAGALLGYFDPLGFSKEGDKAMMAALGAVKQPCVKFLGFEDVPSGLGAVTAAPGTYGFAPSSLFPACWNWPCGRRTTRRSQATSATQLASTCTILRCAKRRSTAAAWACSQSSALSGQRCRLAKTA
ncbi:unnamed protein product, partial [Polarella glacialis]